MKLLLIRHGATAWSESGRHTGRTDVPLTDLGRQQARAARSTVERLVGDELGEAALFVSPLVRARETTGIVFADTALTPVFSDALVELDYGDYEGLTSQQVHLTRPEWDLWADGCPGGESVVDVGHRVDGFLATVEIESRLVIAVAHGHLLRILAARAVGLPPSQGQIFTLDTATVSVIEDVRGKMAVRVWNLGAGVDGE